MIRWKVRSKWKSMWTKSARYRSLFLIVRFRIGEGFLIPIPIPLFLLDQTLDAVVGLAWLADKFMAAGQTQTTRQCVSDTNSCRSRTQLAVSPSLAVKLCREIIAELRRYGKWRMVEADARDPKQERVRLYVDFI